MRWWLIRYLTSQFAHACLFTFIFSLLSQCLFRHTVDSKNISKWCRMKYISLDITCNSPFPLIYYVSNIFQYLLVFKPFLLLHFFKTVTYFCLICFVWFCFICLLLCLFVLFYFSSCFLNITAKLHEIALHWWHHYNEFSSQKSVWMIHAWQYSNSPFLRFMRVQIKPISYILV
jgi:hypothetical protein